MQTDHGSARVFVSYSRKDAEFTDELVISLQSHGFDVVFDREDLFPGEQFEPRLHNLISESDTTVVVMSPNWVASEWCRNEYQIAQNLGRRLLPLLIAPVNLADMPGVIAKLQFIAFHGAGRSFARGMADLVTALRTDISWVREQTRLQGRAEEWENAKRSPALLLRGEALDQAKAWIAEPPPDHVSVLPGVADFIAASDEGATQQQRQKLKRRVWFGALSGLALIGTLGSVILSLQLRNAQLEDDVQIAESAKDAVVQLAVFDETREAVSDLPVVPAPDSIAQPPTTRVDPDAVVEEQAPDAPPSPTLAPEFPEPLGPEPTAETQLVASLNNPNKATRLAAGADVATAVRSKDNSQILDALVTAIEPPIVNGLTSIGRFNTLYMLNVHGDWHDSRWSRRLRAALQRIVTETSVGPQTRDCIDKLRAKLDGSENVANVCGKISNYGLDPYN